MVVIRNWAKHLGLSKSEFLHDLGGGLWGRVLCITEERATAWLRLNTGNRPKVEAQIKSLITDAMANRFELTHEAIAFYEDGSLADAQHRLEMIARSGKNINMLVIVGVSLDARLVINDGRKRSDIDVAFIAGRLPDLDKQNKGELFRIAKAMLQLPETRNNVLKNKQNRLDFAEEHREAILFAIEVLNEATSKDLKQQTIAAVIARAWYHVDHDILRKFGQMLATGSDNGTIANIPLALRNLIIKSADRNPYAERSTVARDLLHMLTVDSLRAFADNESFTLPGMNSRKIAAYRRAWKAETGNAFPLAGEEAVIAAEMVAV